LELGAKDKGGMMRQLIRGFAAAVLAAGVLGASTATAGGGGLNLSWDDCGSNGSADMTFACNTNAGTPFNLFASASPGTALQNFVGTILVIDFQSETTTLPDWWAYGGCRLATSLTAAPAAGVTTCSDITDNPQFGGIDYAVAFEGNASRSRLRTAYAMDAGLAPAVPAGTEYTLMQLTINRNRTTGAGSCTGCATPICIVFNSVLLDQVDTGLPRVIETEPLQRRHVTWQGAPTAFICPDAVPAKSRTWGQLKSLYR